jgi:hypothetical protein
VHRIVHGVDRSAFRLAGCARGAPPQRRRTVRVGRSKCQTAEHCHVLQELRSLLRPYLGVRFVPVPVACERRRDERCGEHSSRETREAPDCEQRTGDDLHCSIDFHETHRVMLDSEY